MGKSTKPSRKDAKKVSSKGFNKEKKHLESGEGTTAIKLSSGLSG